MVPTSLQQEMVKRRSHIDGTDPSRGAADQPMRDGHKVAAELGELSRQRSVSGASASLRASLESMFAKRSEPAIPPPIDPPPPLPPQPPPPPLPPPPPPLPPAPPSFSSNNPLPTARPPPQTHQSERTDGPRGRRPRGRRGSATSSGEATAGSASGVGGWGDSQRWLSGSLLALAVAIMVAVGAATFGWMLRVGAPPIASPEHAAMAEIVRANSDVLQRALQEATARADRAISTRERLGAQLEQCQRDLRERDDYSSAAVPRVDALRDQLREAQDALTRVEAYFGAAAMMEAQRHRGWLRRALSMGADQRVAAGQRVLSG